MILTDKEYKRLGDLIGGWNALNIVYHNMKEDDYRVQKLFNRLKNAFPVIFEGVELYFADNSFTCYMGDPTYPDVNFVIFSSLEVGSIYEFCPTWYKSIVKKLKKINPNLNFHEFALLHELGHYLDMIDNPDNFVERTIQDTLAYEKGKELYNKFLSEDEINYYIYTKLSCEKRATKYALQMAEVLSRNNVA